MSFTAGSVTVRVPASGANLGPGFDALGLALTLYDEITAEVTDDGVSIDVIGQGSDSVPLDDTHLVVQAMRAVFALLGRGAGRAAADLPPHSARTRAWLIVHRHIVGGITAARALVDGGADRLNNAAAFQLAVDLEGHPDNVAAAQFGGLAVSSPGSMAPRLPWNASTWWSTSLCSSLLSRSPRGTPVDFCPRQCRTATPR